MVFIYFRMAFICCHMLAYGFHLVSHDFHMCSYSDSDSDQAVLLPVKKKRLCPSCPTTVTTTKKLRTLSDVRFRTTYLLKPTCADPATTISCDRTSPVQRPSAFQVLWSQKMPKMSSPRISIISALEMVIPAECGTLQRGHSSVTPAYKT